MILLYDKGRKQYILKLSNGKTYNIFYKEGVGLQASILNKRNLWVDSTLLIKDANPDFSAVIGPEDTIYILYQDKHGNIVRSSYKNGDVITKPVLNSKNPTTYNKHLEVLCVNNEVYYFYVLEYSGNKLLSYQVQNSSGVVSTPKVIDYVKDCEMPYKAFQDSDNEIYAVYKGNDLKKPQIGWKKYIREKDQWSEFKSIMEDSADRELISVAADSNQGIQLLYQRKSPQKYELIHSRKEANASQWEETGIITAGPYSFHNASLLLLNHILVCHWLKDNSIYYSTCSINGGPWSKPEKYDFYSGKPSYCMLYQSNVPEEHRNTFAAEVPGNFMGGYKLAFIQDTELKASAPSMDEVRTLFTDTLKSLSKNMEEVKQAIAEINSKLDDLDIKQSQTEIEISKLSIKSSLLDSDFSKLKERAEWISRPKETVDTSLKISAGDALFNNSEPIPGFYQEITETSAVTENYPSSAVNEFMQSSDRSKIPFMPGAGFSSITPEFLQKLAKK